ncbi:hypothetical protein GCM10009730_63010 [Streptomyces albidochromogenes]
MKAAPLDLGLDKSALGRLAEVLDERKRAFASPTVSILGLALERSLFSEQRRADLTRGLGEMLDSAAWPNVRRVSWIMARVMPSDQGLVRMTRRLTLGFALRMAVS